MLSRRGADGIAAGRRRLAARATSLRRIGALMLVLALATGGAGAFYLRTLPPPDGAAAGVPAPRLLPDQPSIAVLPFDNLSGEPSQEYFADGITEDLITDLSKSAGLFVIARNSSFKYKGQALEPQRVAAELGVRYLLEGSVRQANDRIRINAQLIDTTTGGHVWADRYDGQMSDVFALQDRVSRRIVDSLALSLTTRDERSYGATAVAEAYDTFLKGWEHFQKRSPEHYARALAYFRQAVALDPDYSRALAAIASVYWKSAWEGWHPTLGVSAEQAKEAASSHLAHAMAAPTPLAHQVAAQMALWRGSWDEAVAEAERAVALDPSDADSRAVLAEVLIYDGRPEDAVEAIEAARRLDPHNEARYAYLEGFARLSLKEFEVAAGLLARALELGPDLWPVQPTFREADCDPCELLLGAYGYLEESDKAAAVRDRLSGTWASNMLNVRSIVAHRPYRRPEDAEQLAEGLRRAGLEEY